MKKVKVVREFSEAQKRLMSDLMDLCNHPGCNGVLKSFGGSLNQINPTELEPWVTLEEVEDD